jgi:hypothetical protein
LVDHAHTPHGLPAFEQLVEERICGGLLALALDQDV